MMTLAPMSRDASTVLTRWLATSVSTWGPAGDIDDYDLRSVRPDPSEQLIGQLLARWLSSTPMIGQYQQPFVDLQHRRRQLEQGVLLLADDPLPLFHEAHGDGVRDAVRRGLVRVQHAIQQSEVVVVLEKK